MMPVKKARVVIEPLRRKHVEKMPRKMHINHAPFAINLIGTPVIRSIELRALWVRLNRK